MFTLEQAKANFFDRKQIRDAMDDATMRALAASSAQIRVKAQRSMRYRKFGGAPSSPGSPPRARTGRNASLDSLVRKMLFFALDKRSRSSVIGPVALSRGTGAPNALEFGGISPGQDRRRVRRVGDGGELRIVGSESSGQKRGKGGRFLTSAQRGQEVPGVPGVRVVYGKIRTSAQAARATRINAQIYGAPKPVRIVPRPFMAPAMLDETPRMASRWKNSIGGI